MQFFVPTWFIPTKKVDHEAEVIQFISGRRRFGRLDLPAPYCCYYSMLELISSKFFTDPGTCSDHDVAKALLILCEGRSVLADVEGSLRGSTRFETLASRFWKRHRTDIIAHYNEIVEWCLVLPAEGFDMLPRAGKSEKPFWFDSEYLAWTMSIIIRQTGEPMSRALWDVSFLSAGHMIAAFCRQNGEKGVGRKPDDEAYRREMAAAKERELRGELHPWQISHPDRYRPSQTQIDARFEILKEWEALTKCK